MSRIKKNKKKWVWIPSLVQVWGDLSAFIFGVVLRWWATWGKECCGWGGNHRWTIHPFFFFFLNNTSESLASRPGDVSALPLQENSAIGSTIGNKVLDLADGQHQKDSWSIDLRLHAPLIWGRDIKQVCHFISWRTHLKFWGGFVLILDLSCGTSYFAKINEFIIIHSSGTFCRLRYLLVYFWVLRPETFPAKVLPIMVSLRGRCLEVMTCSEGAMDWIRMMGWLGS